MATEKRFTNATGSPVADNTNILTAGPRGPALLQDIWLIEIKESDPGESSLNYGRNGRFRCRRVQDRD